MDPRRSGRRPPSSSHALVVGPAASAEAGASDGQRQRMGGHLAGAASSVAAPIRRRTLSGPLERELAAAVEPAQRSHAAATATTPATINPTWRAISAHLHRENGSPSAGGTGSTRYQNQRPRRPPRPRPAASSA
jgi:hypothetical protein